MKKKIFFIFLFLNIININYCLSSINNSIIGKVGKEIITQYDLENEIKTILFLGRQNLTQENIDKVTKLAMNSIVRKLIKNECSKGWLVEEQSKKTKLVRRNDDGKQAVTLPIPYEPLEQTTILNAVVGIRKLMLKDKTLNLKQAAEIYLDNNDMSIKPKTKVVGTWETIRRDFEKAREGLAKSTRNETARRLTRLLGVIDGKKIVSKLSHYDKKLKKNIYADTVLETFQKPTNGDQLIRKYDQNLIDYKNKLETLEIKRKKINKFNYHDLTVIKSLLISCRNNGTKTFSCMARYGFIAESFLRSIKEEMIWSEERVEQFRSSIETVLTSFLKELNSSSKDNNLKKNFIEKYGHLRPGTYDILAPRYDNQLDNMKAIFIAKGPSFKSGYKRDEFENIHVYPLITYILGIEPYEKIDGDLDVVKDLLSK